MHARTHASINCHQWWRHCNYRLADYIPELWLYTCNWSIDGVVVHVQLPAAVGRYIRLSARHRATIKLHSCATTIETTAIFTAEEKKMGAAKTFAIVIASLALVLLLVPLTAEGQSSCGHAIVNLTFTESFEDDVNCTGVNPHVRCFGSCNSKSIVEQRGNAFHWKQDCECCQPIGGYYAIPMYISLNCTDGSTRFFNSTLVIPRNCHCTDCWPCCCILQWLLFILYLYTFTIMIHINFYYNLIYL